MKHDIAAKLIKEHIALAKTRKLNLEREVSLVAIQIGELTKSLACLSAKEPTAEVSKEVSLASAHPAYVIVASGQDGRVGITSTQIGLTHALANLARSLEAIDYTRTIAFAFGDIQIARAVASGLHRAHQQRRYPATSRSWVYDADIYSDAVGVLLFGASILKVADIEPFETPERHVTECTASPEGDTWPDVFQWLLTQYRREHPPTKMRSDIKELLAGLHTR